MRVIFEVRTTPRRAEERGRIELLDGKLSFTPPELNRFMKLQERGHPRWELDRSDPTAYLRKLPELFKGLYYYATLEE